MWVHCPNCPDLFGIDFAVSGHEEGHEADEAELAFELRREM